MKQKLQITNAFLGLMVLFSVLFQSIHTFEHVIQQFFGEVCLHKYSDEATLNHSHHWEKCTVCDFAFSPTTEIKSVIVSSKIISDEIVNVFLDSSDISMICLT